MNPDRWKGRHIVSQYGIVCTVINARYEQGITILTCRSHYNDRIWEWQDDTVSLISKSGEIVNHLDGDVFGTIEADDWDWRLYENNEGWVMTKEQLENEFCRT
jgi:hypothetical protein